MCEKTNQLSKAVESLGNVLDSLSKTPAAAKKLGELDFGASKFGSLNRMLDKNYSEFTALVNMLKKCRHSEIFSLFESMAKAYVKKDFTLMKQYLRDISLLLPVQQQKQLMMIPKLPLEISGDVNADISEVMRCYDSGCYRSAVILCGRILEIALHRKYFEFTGKDILETNPGIGLGTLIAKLSDKGFKFPPGIAEQIHLINKVRIESVHKKSNVFIPSKEQAKAIILYTTDVLKKLFQ